MLHFWRGTTLVLAGIGLAVFSGGQSPVRAQVSEFETAGVTQMRDALVGPTNTYVALPASRISINDATSISVSPGKEDAVIISSPASVPRSLDALLTHEETRKRKTLNSGGRYDLQLHLLSQGDDHVQSVWRGGGSITSGVTEFTRMYWLAGTRLLVLQVVRKPGPLPENYLVTDGQGAPPQGLPPTVSVVVINGATGKSQTLAANLSGATRLINAWKSPALIVVDSDNGIIQRIENDKIGPRLPVRNPPHQKQPIYWRYLLPEDRTLVGSGTTTNPDGTVGQDTVYHFDTVTGTITTPKEPDGPLRINLSDVPVPFVVQREKVTLTRDGVAKIVYPLWLEGRDKETQGRTLLAADSDPDQEPVVLQTAVLYRHQGSVYSVPILKFSSAEFLARRQEVWKAETINRARRIGQAWMAYIDNHGVLLPPVGSDIPSVLARFSRERFLFENPVSGQNGFTALYKESSFPPPDSAATRLFGSLDGPGGKAIIYLDGHVKWQDGTDAKP